MFSFVLIFRFFTQQTESFSAMVNGYSDRWLHFSCVTLVFKRAFGFFCFQLVNTLPYNTDVNVRGDYFFCGRSYTRTLKLPYQKPEWSSFLETVLDRIPLQLTVCSNKPNSVVGRSQLRQITNDHTYFYHTEQVVWHEYDTCIRKITV